MSQHRDPATQGLGVQNSIDVDNQGKELAINIAELEDECLLNDPHLTPQEASSNEPAVGMTFDSMDSLYEFYRKYAYSVGFPVVIRNTQKGPDDKVRYVIIVCGREGNRKSVAVNLLRPRPTGKTGCMARISASFDNSGSWRINKVYLTHNHNCSPSKSRLFSCNRKISEHVKRRLVIQDKAGVSLHKSFNTAVVEEGGHENLSFTEKDCRNFIEKERRYRLGGGDAAALMAYFVRMQNASPELFYCIDVDDEGRLTNLFWADNRSRQATLEFGDVVTFDTTYLVNKYDMPFAPFVGINHHGQSTLLGCGLVSTEDTESFIWLFRSWRRCMHGSAPMAIVTDQCIAMKNAIEVVFPESRHRWCLWHILKKFPEKFGGNPKKEAIIHSLNAVIYESQFPEEFEEDWNTEITKFGLKENTWLAGLYSDRARWVPCFFRTNFWAGVSSTQRSESMNAFFDGFVHSKTTLKQFVEQYEFALKSKVEKEFVADCKSFTRMVPCLTTFDIERQFQNVYTISKFQEFQKELAGLIYCRAEALDDDDVGQNFKVEEIVTLPSGRKKNQTFFVSYVREHNEVECSCHLFEFEGILCRHAISVLNYLRVENVHERYILRRWRRDVRRLHTKIAIGDGGWLKTPEQDRFDQLCQKFARVANGAAQDEGRTKMLLDWMDSQPDLEARDVRYVPTDDRVVESLSYFPITGTSMCPTVLDPKTSRRKGRPRTQRLKGGLERNAKKKRGNSKKKTQPTSCIQLQNSPMQMPAQPSADAELQVPGFFFDGNEDQVVGFLF